MARTSDWHADNPERAIQRIRRYQCQQCHVEGLTRTRLDGTRSTGDGFVVLEDNDETPDIEQTTLITDGGTDTGGIEQSGITTCPECGDPMYADEEWTITDRSLIGTEIGDEGIEDNYTHARCVDTDGGQEESS